MELCFIPDGDTQGFLRARVPQAFTPGEIVDQSGRVLGQHQGIAAYTVGQRKGLGIAHPKPLYVLEVDPALNRVIVGEEEELKTETCLVREPRWMAVPDLTVPIDADVKIRYRTARVPARLTPMAAGVEIRFHQPVVGGVSPGQAAVFYQGDCVLGGGWIAKNDRQLKLKQQVG
jgi:tRNA-specific 2-thiouridylase